MNKVTLFKAITTEEALTAIETEAASYEGLHVEMSDPEQRKFVKGKLSEITDITKKVDRARIDLAKAHKSGLDKEAAEIIKRLEVASKPFTDLTNEWKAERQKILDHKKAQEAEKQKLIDHEDAIMHNKIFDMEKREAEEKAKAEAERLKQEAIAEAQEKAKQDAILAEQRAQQALIDAENKRLHDIEQERLRNEQQVAQEKQRVIDAENARIAAEEKARQDAIDAENRRLADIERTKREQLAAQKAETQRLADELAQREANQAHVVSICKAAKESLMQQANLTEEQAINAVKAIRSNLIQNVTIQF